MADVPPPAALDRIDGAIARIEAAARRQTHDTAALAKRHADLRARMAEAVAALDAVIERGTDA